MWRQSSVLQNNGISDTVEGNIKGSKGTFESYCDLLSTAVERDNIKVLDVGLVNSSAQHDNANRDNWNRDRKSISIVAPAS